MSAINVDVCPIDRTRQCLSRLQKAKAEQAWKARRKMTDPQPLAKMSQNDRSFTRALPTLVPANTRHADNPASLPVGWTEKIMLGSPTEVPDEGSAKKHRGRPTNVGHFHEDVGPNHFLCIIFKPTFGWLMIHQDFVKWFGEIPSNIIITTNTRCNWRMTTKREGNDAFIDQGWTAFAIAHHLKVGQFLTFKKVFSFEYSVVIFDHTCTEVISVDNFKSLRLHTLLTSAFSHIDAKHLFNNMLGLYFFGSSIARIFGPAYLLQLYVEGAIFGSTFFLGEMIFLASRKEGFRGWNTPALGASAAVNATILLYIFMFPMSKIYLLFFIPLPAALVGAGLIGADLWRVKKGKSRVSGSAHLGGALVAALLFAEIKGWI
ncbi:hypothetical protein QYE76_020451 [Lolium multiflorum]|uniref:TF-B3 domain-containing protein n=1 Tax=Lolium multiflorum TaxID=4521 RepID=A0AAD8R7R6_LOLMU|nr:hypothetical protein QYE76_020451 [Lolium multiflorum]